MGPGTIIALVGMVISIILCVLTIINSYSARITKAESDGRILERIDTVVKGVNEIKKDLRTTSNVIDDHSKDIVENTAKIESVQQELKRVQERMDRCNNYHG